MVHNKGLSITKDATNLGSAGGGETVCQRRARAKTATGANVEGPPPRRRSLPVTRNAPLMTAPNLSKGKGEPLLSQY